MIIATSIEQSKKLIDAGVSEKSADMFWLRHFDFKGEYRLMCSSIRHYRYFTENQDDCVKAWSLSALWNIVHNLDKTYEFDTTMSARELLNFLVETICYRFTHPNPPCQE